jgi:hypothetical protein
MLRIGHAADLEVADFARNTAPGDEYRFDAPIAAVAR